MSNATVKSDHESDGLTMVVAPAEAHRRLQELQAFVQSSMVRDTDYGVIPGTQKPTLLQPGAQKMAEIYGFGHRFVPAESVKDWERGFFYFEYRCQLFLRRDGRELAEGIGSCNSRESKYAERWVFDNDMPAGVDKASLKKKDFTGRNGRPFSKYCVPNPDPYSLVNTIQKMAAKRAYIHAIIAATRSSGILTQDVEDLPPEAFGKPEAARSWETAAAPHDPATGEILERQYPPPKIVTTEVYAAVDPKLAALERFAAHESALAKAVTIDELRIAWDDVCDAGKRQIITLTQKAALNDQKNARKKAIQSEEKARTEASLTEALDQPKPGEADPWDLRPEGP